MSRRRGLACLALAAAALAAPAGLRAGENERKPAEPFYRKYLLPGDPHDAMILEQERRIEASPDDAALRNDLGNLLADRRFYEQAAEEYERAARLDETNFVSYYNLGLVREAEGKSSAAVSAYKKSIARKPGFPPSRFRLGRLYELSGKGEQAVQEYARALRIDPAMRNPRRNPLVIDSDLMYRASLENYQRDLARASMTRDEVYYEEARFRVVPVDRALSAAEVTPAEPVEVEAVDAVAEPGPATAPAPDPSTSGRRTRQTAAPPGARPPRPPTTGSRPSRTRPVPVPAPAAEPPARPEPSAEEPAPPPDAQPEGDPSAPETMPEPTPGPEFPDAPPEVEPS